MQMGDEDGDDTPEVQTLTAQLTLRTLPAVHDEELITKLHDLGRRVVLHRRQSRATA